MRRFLLGLVILVVLGGGLYGLLHTAWGRRHLAEEISRIVSSRVEGEWRVEDLSGWLPFAMNVGRLSAGDSSSAPPWLVVEGCAVEVNLRSVLDRRILLDRVVVERVTLGPRPPRKKSRKTFTWDAIPSAHIPVVRIGEFRLEGGQGASIPPIAIEGDLEHRNGEGGSRFAVGATSISIQADATISRPDSATPWSCRVAVQADAGSPLHDRFPLPAESAWTLEASTVGWGGDLWIESPAAGILTGPFELHRTDEVVELEFSPELTLVPERVPASLARYTGYQASGRCRVRKPANGSWSIDDVHLRVGDHHADLEITLPREGDPWSIGFQGTLGLLVFKEMEVGEAFVQGRVDGGKNLGVALTAEPRGIHGLPRDLLAWLGAEPSLHALLRIEPSRIDVQRLAVHGAAGEVEAEGLVDLRARSLEATWRGRLHTLERLPSLGTRAWAVPTQPVELTGEVSVTQRWTAVTGTVRSEAITLADGRVERAQVQYAVNTDQTNAPFWITAEVAGLEAKHLSIDEVVLNYADGRGDLPETEVRVGPAVVRVGGEADAEGLHARAILAEQSLAEIPGWEEVSGVATGSLRIGGTWEQPEIEANLGVSDVRSSLAGADGFKPAQGTAELVLARGTLHAEAHLHTTGESRLDLVTDLPVAFRLRPWAAHLPEATEGTISIRGLLDLDAVNAMPVMAEQHLSGILELDLAAEGTPRSPRFRGTGRIRDGRYEHFVMGTDLRDLTLLLEADDQRLTIRSLRATDPTGGTLSGTGYAVLRPQENFPFEFDLVLQHIQLLANDLLTAAADGTLRLAGTPAAMKVRGALTLAPVQIQIPAHLPPASPGYTVIDPLRPESPPPSPRQAKATGGIELDVDVEVPSRMTVRGRGLDSQWGGRVSVRGTAAKPRVVGQLHTQRGRFNFFGQPFILAESSIRFTGESPPRPSLDITFERKRSDRTAYLKIGGNTGNPLLELTSDPPLPSDELLPLVLFGKDIRDISPLQAVRAAQAARALQGEGSAFDFMGHAQRLLAVDQLNIEQADDPEGLAKITAGKYLSDRVYIEGQNQAGPDNGRISLEVELTPRISLETNIEAEMKQGVGLKFKRHF